VAVIGDVALPPFEQGVPGGIGDFFFEVVAVDDFEFDLDDDAEHAQGDLGGVQGVGVVFGDVDEFCVAVDEADPAD
jgi:hypothetical protein